MPIALTSETVTTPLGAFILVVDRAGDLRAAEFADCASRLRRLLDRRLGASRYDLEAGAVPSEAKEALEAYFSGDLAALRLVRVTSAGTTFQDQVWSALRSIDPGRPLTYSALARQLGRPQSARAVGHANGANPFSIIVPCHRLVGANGTLVGYGGGVERKRWLLDHEASHARIDH